MLNRNKLVFILAGILFAISSISAQNNARISADELIYNFGTIGESDGLASHIFTIKNTGNGPLVITRITASCGCTQPEWTKEPIAPGKTGEVKVTYNPKGRPGPFYKTIAIYSNGKKGSFSLGIKGNVTPKEAQPILIYPYSIGDLKLQTKNILYSTIRPEETLGEKINLINEGKTSLNIHLGKTPHYLNVVANPTKLAPGETGEISILMNAKEAKRKGRMTAEIPVTVESIGQKKGTEGKLHVAANIIDDFSNLTVIYSVTCEDERVAVSGGKREIKPGTTATFKVTVRPKEIKTKLEALINFVCNDPNGPVRLVKVTANK